MIKKVKAKKNESVPRVADNSVIDVRSEGEDDDLWTGGVSQWREDPAYEHMWQHWQWAPKKYYTWYDPKVHGDSLYWPENYSPGYGKNKVWPGYDTSASTAATPQSSRSLSPSSALDPFRK